MRTRVRLFIWSRVLIILISAFLVQRFHYSYAGELSDGSFDDGDDTIESTICQEERLVDFSYEEDNLSDQDESILCRVEADTSFFCPRSFARYSFAGMSGEDIKINPDWSFTIESHDHEMIQGEGYNGAILYTRYLGQFGAPIQLNEYSFILPIISIIPEHKDGYNYITDSGMMMFFYELDSYAKLEQFILYLPGTPVSVFSNPDYWINRAIDPNTGVIQEGSYLLNGYYYGTADSESDGIPIPTPISTPTPTPSPTPAVPFSAEVPPEVTGFYNSVKGADLRWTDVPGAEGYEVYRKRAADGTKKVATINAQEATQYYDGEIKDNCWGRVYVYYIVPFAGDEEGTTSTQVTLQRLAPMKITECQNTSVGSVDLSWACTVNDNKALGYEIQYAESKEDLYGRTGSFMKFTVNGRNKLSKTITGLEAGKTYYFRIRCYVNYTHSVTGKQTKTWSQYSDVAEVMIENG